MDDKSLKIELSIALDHLMENVRSPDQYDAFRGDFVARRFCYVSTNRTEIKLETA